MQLPTTTRLIIIEYCTKSMKMTSLEVLCEKKHDPELREEQALRGTLCHISPQPTISNHLGDLLPIEDKLGNHKLPTQPNARPDQVKHPL